jgi:ariadne-1
LSTKVVGEGRGQTISCPEHNCDIIVDDAKAMALIRDEKVKRRYQHLITNSFVEVGAT